MSGMKFRLKCSGCGTAFFTPDRKARLCPKCSRKGETTSFQYESGTTQSARPSSSSQSTSQFRRSSNPEGQRQTDPRQGSRSAHSSGFASKPKLRKAPAPKKPGKIKALTPDLEQKLASLYEEKYSGKKLDRQQLVTLISDELWLKRNIVVQALHKLMQPPITIPQDTIEKIINMYKGFVERGERPDTGRRNHISKSLGVPYQQVRRIIYDWSLSQFKTSPTVELTREQKFQVEKLYFTELKNKKHPLPEFPSVISGQLGYTIPYQVARWLDTLHDDDSKFVNVPDVPTEVENKIWDAYQNYLDAPQPPDKGLHSSIAQLVGDITSRQVHKSLHRFRKVQRETYPLK